MNDPGTTRPWLTVRRGHAPLVVSIPHAGTNLAHVREQVISEWLARLDADWWIDRLYDFAPDLDATVVSTAISRTVVDVNRDPASRELYPGLAGTELVPTTTFDGTLLYPQQGLPSSREQASRRHSYFDPYHEALRTQLERLRAIHPVVVLYDAHSIRSRVPRLFDGELPIFNIGTYAGRSCAPVLANSVAGICGGFSGEWVVDGRFKGGYITRHYGQPARGVHAIQMEVACRAYLSEPSPPLEPANWPPVYSSDRAAALRGVLRDVLAGCLRFASSHSSGVSSQ